MILTCPECATRFSVKSDAIGPNGRTVRCSQCSVTWFASADPDILSLNEIKNSDAAVESYEEQEPEVTASVEFDDHEHGTEPSNEPHAVIRDKAEQKKARRRLLGVGMIWLTTLTIIALAAFLAWLFRAQIVEKFPGTRSVYSAFGIEASNTGLIIQNIRTEYGDVDGTPVLFVEGEIENYDVQTRDVPMVQIKFKNDNDEVIATWAIEPPKTKLQKGETQTFSGQYPNPPIDATKLVPVFIDELANTVVRAHLAAK
ncbi:MAG: DUF3426 domain-containing protein [Hyphomonadaceae bacterium]|nr:DUF3426 domain-containing protein [Hyphomonadaceae bacterium]